MRVTVLLTSADGASGNRIENNIIDYILLLSLQIQTLFMFLQK